MPQVFAITSIPDGLDGAGAGAGQVWTADGSNDAGWQTPSGGAGAAFAFDGATFVIGEYVAGSGVRAITVELTSGGAPISAGSAGLFLMVIDAGGTVWNQLSGGFDVNGAKSRFYLWDGIYNTVASLQCTIDASDGHMILYAEVYNQTETDSQDLYMQIVLPSGSVATSAAFVVPTQ